MTLALDLAFYATCRALLDACADQHEPEAGRVPIPSSARPKCARGMLQHQKNMLTPRRTRTSLQSSPAGGRALEVQAHRQH